MQQEQVPITTITPMQAEFTSIQKKALETSVDSAVSILLLGQMGSGKTRTISTAPKPLLVHEFDAQGAETIRTRIKLGQLKEADIAIEDFAHLKNFQEWVNRFNALERMGMFNHLGTFAIDGLTQMMQKMFDASAGAKDGRQDYMALAKTMREVFDVLTKTKCVFITTAHIALYDDAITGRLVNTVATIGKASQNLLPGWFSEIYTCLVQSGAKGLEYLLQTQFDGHYLCRTRIGTEKFARYEQPDIEALLRKAGRIK